MGMIDVGSKGKTRRIARAEAFVKLNEDIIRRIKNNDMPKGNVLENARVAAILAVKKTSELIPLCHNLDIEYADVDFILKKGGILVESTVKTTGKTGVEMEAMVACSVAALTIYDMCKMFTKSIEIKDIYLVEKRGGESGVYKRDKE